MSRTPISIKLPLFVMTALVFWQIHSLADTKSFANTHPGRQVDQIASDFYAAVNATLETGDPAVLTSMLPPIYLDHAADREEPGTAADLAKELLALRSAFPDMRVAARTILAQGPLVMASISFTGDRQGSIEGDLPVELVDVPSGFELLKFENGKIIERWTSISFRIAPDVLMRGTIDYVASGISQRTPRLERLSLEPHAFVEIGAQASGLLFIESGEVSIRSDSVGTLGAVPESLHTGQMALLPVNAPVTLANTGSSGTRVLLLQVPLFDHPDPTYAAPARPLPPGVSRDLLLEGPTLSADTGAASISLRRIHLSSGSVIPNHVIDGSHLVLVEEGHLVVHVERSDLTLLSDHAVSSGSSDEILLGPGQSISSLAGDKVGYRPAGPSHSTFVVITLSPVTA